MAVAVLERDVQTLEKEEATSRIKVNSGFNTRMSEDEQHNAKIGEIYARLINSDANVDEVLGRSQEAAKVSAPKDIFAKPYLVENARADSAIWRADSPVNRKVSEMQLQMAAADAEEENEDLRPTSTTIQYKTTRSKRLLKRAKLQTPAWKNARACQKRKNNNCGCSQRYSCYVYFNNSKFRNYFRRQRRLGLSSNVFDDSKSVLCRRER